MQFFWPTSVRDPKPYQKIQISGSAVPTTIHSSCDETSECKLCIGTPNSLRRSQRQGYVGLSLALNENRFCGGKVGKTLYPTLGIPLGNFLGLCDFLRTLLQTKTPFLVFQQKQQRFARTDGLF